MQHGALTVKFLFKSLAQNLKTCVELCRVAQSDEISNSALNYNSQVSK